MRNKNFLLLLLFWLIFTTHSFAQVKVSFTWDTIFLKDTYCRRVSVSPNKHCWAITNKDSSGVYEIDNTDITINRTAGVQSATSSKYSDIVALDSNVTLIGTASDYLIKYKAGIYSKLGAAAGFKTKNINSLERIGQNVSYITKYANQNKSGVAVGTARGLHISYDNSIFNSTFDDSFGFRNDSITIVHYINFRGISTNVKHFSPLCDQGIGYGDGFLDWTHAHVTVGISHSSLFDYIEEDSVNTLVDIPISLWFERLTAGGKHIWGTKNGLRYRILECGTTPVKYLEGTSVNKLYEMVFFPYEKYHDNPYQRGALLIGSDSGLYYDPMDWHIKYYSSAPDTLYFANVTKGYKINDIEVDACNSRVWLATDKGIIRLNIHYAGSLSNGSPLPQSGSDLPLCASGTVTITANKSSYYSYQWQKDSINIFGANSSEYTTASPGNYQVIYTYSDECRTYTDTSAAVKVRLDTLICTSAIFPDTVNLCPGETYFINSNCTLASNTYQWYRNGIVLGGENQSSYTANMEGSYKLKISNCNFSKFSDSVYIKLLPEPVLTITPSRTLCIGDTAKISVTSGNYSISWYKHGIPVYSNSSTDYYATTSDTYYAEFSKNNCSITSIPLNLLFNPISKVNIVANKSLPLCEGDEIMLTAQNNGNNYQWSSGENTKIIYKKSAGHYKVVSYDYNNCRSADSILVALTPRPIFTLGKDTTFCEGYNKPVNIILPGHFAYYAVNTIPIKSKTLEVYTAGQYIITAADYISCSNSDTIVVFNSCPEIFIPNLITPNGDNKNDFFCIEGLLPKCSLEIYNRWGDRVYLNANYNNDWSGEELSDDVYYYTFKSSYYNRSWKGWVEIIR